MTSAVVSGLKLFALVVVADAVLTMAGQFCRKRLPLTLAVGTAAGLWLWPGLAAQFVALLAAALIGTLWLKHEGSRQALSPRVNWPFLVLFAGLFLLLPLLARGGSAGLFADFYQAGSLVFGGGHVVLPLLQNLLADTLSSEVFLTGYAAAQAMPGPMFTLATFLGAELLPESPVIGALVATFGVFLPGFLLVLALLNGWQTLAANPRMAGAIAGVNAAVVGLLLAALYQPVFVASVTGAPALAAAALGLLALRVFRCPLLVLIPAFMLLGVWL